MTAGNNSMEVAQILAAFLKKELVLYREVYELSLVQRDIIRERNSEKLLSVIDEKQMRIAKVNLIETEAAAYKKIRDRDLEKWDAGVRAIVDPYIIELREVLGNIVAVEEDCRKAAEEFTKSSSAQVVKIQKGKAMLNAYGKSTKSPSSNIPRFKDKKG